MQDTPNNKRLKTISIFLLVFFILIGLGIAVFTVAINILPKKEAMNESSNDATTAQQTYDQAKKAEEKRDFTKAKSLYEKALPYYKDKSDESVMDKNIAYGIEARITAMQDQLNTLEKNRAAESANPVINYE